MGKRFFLGILLIAVGLGFLLEQFEIISFSEAFSTYWPSILVLIGLSGLLDKKSSKFGNLLLIILGGLIQVDRLDLVDINVYRLFWPIILILAGLQIIVSRSSIAVNTGSNNRKKSFSKNISTEDVVNEFVLMSGIETNNQSQQFKGGKVTAIMGGIDIDFRGARLHNNEALLEVNAIMGGVNIIVPETWRVEVKGTPILGGWGNKRKQNIDPKAPVLIVNCFVMFGGMDIK